MSFKEYLASVTLGLVLGIGATLFVISDPPRVRAYSDGEHVQVISATGKVLMIGMVGTENGDTVTICSSRNGNCAVVNYHNFLVLGGK